MTVVTLCRALIRIPVLLLLLLGVLPGSNGLTAVAFGAPVAAGGAALPGGAAAGASVTVSRLSITPLLVSLGAGKTHQYVATATFSDGSRQNVTSSVSWVSANPAAVSVSPGGLAVGVAGSTNLVSIHASLSGVVSNASFVIPPPVLTRITITPSASTLALNATRQFSAVGTYSNGSSQSLTNNVTWASSNPAIVSISASGSAKALATSATGIKITASLSGVTSNTATVTPPSALTKIVITPASATLALNGTQQFVATGTYNNGSTANITSSVAWVSSKPAALTVSAAGVAKAIAASASSATISASLSGITSNVATVALPPVLTSIAISPASTTLALNATQQFAATGTYSNGSTANITSSVAWVSSNPASLTVGATGLAKAIAASASSATITASLSGVTSNVATVTLPPALTSIAITPASAKLALNATQQFVATGTYSNGTTGVITSSVAWTSSLPAALSINTAGLAQAIAASATVANVTASLQGITSNVAAVTLPPVLTKIAITPASATLALSGTQQYTATGTYSDSTTGVITGTVTWTSSNVKALTITSAGLAQAIAGSTAPASITASLGSITSNVATVTLPPALTSIAITPATANVAQGGTQQYAATGLYSDGTSQNVTATATWTSSSPANVTISPAGLASVVASSTSAVSISAAIGTIVSNVATLTTQATLTSIAITPASLSVGIGASQQYVATGTYNNGTTQNITNTVTWTSGSPSVVSISATGFANVLGTSTTAIPITASSGTVTSNTAFLSALSTLPRVCSSPTVDLKVLVVTSGKGEADYPAILQILDYVGTPYTVLDMATGGITPTLLSDGQCHGYYQAVIMASGGYIYQLSGMSTLTSYEQTFAVRQVNWYTYPGSDFGFNAPSGSLSSNQTETGTYTADSASVFPYLNASTPLSINNASVYLAQPLSSPPAGTKVTPLITDPSGFALSLLYDFGDGRQYLTQTFDSNPYLVHDQVLAYGLLNWVTKGLFLGQYHVYASASVDDFFINDSEWIPGTPCTDPVTKDRTPPDASFLPNFRLSASDMTSLVNWQNNLQKDPLLSTFALTLAFNGVGTTGNTAWTGLPSAGRSNDGLVMAVPNYEKYFHWVTHTFDHPNTLNGLHKSDTAGDPDTPKVDSIDLEILTNQFVANGSGVNLDTDTSDVVVPLHFTDFNPANAVTPGVTGLNDPLVPTYLQADGIRYAVSDTSVATITNPPNNNGPNPSPNVGIVNSYAPGIYEVPRHPNSIYYNAANWNDDQAEFACIYNNPVQPPYNTYTAAQILDYTSTAFVGNMLIGDMDSQMFHQPNLHDYDGLGHSLISDTYDATFKKYEALYKLPVLSLTIDGAGKEMQARNAYNLSGVTASVVGAPGAQQIVLTMPASAAVPSASIPVSGTASSGSEIYGGTKISHVVVNAGQSITLPIQ